MWPTTCHSIHRSISTALSKTQGKSTTEKLTTLNYIRQTNTPWADGVSGLSQWAIKPGDKYRYQWKATTYGTYWYHAHDKDRIMDGLYGGIRIR